MSVFMILERGVRLTAVHTNTKIQSRPDEGYEMKRNYFHQARFDIFVTTMGAKQPCLHLASD